MNWETIKDHVIDNAQEPSTWRGVVYVLTAAGLQLDPEQQAVIVSVGLAIAGLIALTFKDKGATHG
jgi:hypothetical protein